MKKASRRLAWLLPWMGLVCSAAKSFAATDLQMLRQAVFKINVVSSDPSYLTPWKKNAPSASNGTGFYIGRNQILTNAHVIANATFITVLRDGESTPVPARVRFVAHDCDLALLEPDDPSMFKGKEPMGFGSLPKLRSPVATIGFPTGGEQVSITEGIVSRVGYRRYVHHGSFSHLLVQVDSAINPGNSGGPVVQGRQVVGVAFQSFTQAENTGYIIPTPVIQRFLKDVEDGRYDGHPEDGLKIADWALLNGSTAAYHGLSRKEGGVKIAFVADWASTAGQLQAGDIILAIDSYAVGVDGKISYHDERVDFRTIYDLKQIGDQVRFQIVRDGKRLEVVVDIKKAQRHHAQALIYAKHPRYFVWGGLVFTSLSRSLLRSWGDKWFRVAPLLLRYLDAYAEREPVISGMGDLIVLIKRLPDEVNSYASDNIHGVVENVDGERVASIEQFAERLEKGTGPFAVMRFIGSPEPLVLSRKAVQERNGVINARYGVQPDRWFGGEDDDGAISVSDAKADAPAPHESSEAAVKEPSKSEAGATPASSKKGKEKAP